MNEAIIKSAVISNCGRYRYRLKREWDESRWMMPIVMLNPSTADAELDDPTIRRCVGFARREGFGGIDVANLYAFRSASPAEMRRDPNPIGPNNDATLIDLAKYAAAAQMPIVCAWGTGAGMRANDVIRLCFLPCGARLACLGKTKDGHPRHPLYVRNDRPLEPFA